MSNSAAGTSSPGGGIDPGWARSQLSAHRLLVTHNDPDRFGLLELSTQYASWVESRAGQNGTTWLVTCFGTDLQYFLAMARRAGVTVEEIDGSGADEKYRLLLGDSGTGWVPEPDGREVRFSFRMPLEFFEKLSDGAAGLADEIRARRGEPLLIADPRTGDPVQFAMAGPEPASLWQADGKFESAVSDPRGEGLVITLVLPGWTAPSPPWPAAPGLKTGAPAAGS